MKKLLILLITLVSLPSLAANEILGEVVTNWHGLSPNDTISVEVFDDPHIKGVSCLVSKANKGGYKAIVNMEEDTSDASIACRQVGPMVIPGQYATKRKPVKVFDESRSPLFKRLHVVRVYDPARQLFGYLVYTDKLVDGSPKNSITAVPVQSWYAGDKLTPPVFGK